MPGGVGGVRASLASTRFVKTIALRQLVASRLAERTAGKRVPEAIREHERLVAERGASAASASERTRELAGL